MHTKSERVCVRTENKHPVRILCRGNRFVVTDTPTPVRRHFAAPELTHPPEPLWRWRFQATNEQGDGYVFDVRIGAGWAWELVAVSH